MRETDEQAKIHFIFAREVSPMYRVLYCTLFEHDLPLLLLALFVCAATFIVTAFLWVRQRVARRRWQHAWLASMGVVTGGGVWATHFIAMLAYQSSFPLGFSLWTTMLSLVLAIAFSTLAFLIKFRTHNSTGIIASGLCFATGVTALHYVGMAAIDAPAQMRWDGSLVAASWFIAAAFAVGAMQIARGGVTLNRRLQASAGLGASVLSLHFTGMGALTLIPDPTIAPLVAGVLQPLEMSLIVTTIVVLCLIAVVVLAISDERITDAEAKNAAKSGFLASMSHELRTPLSCIISYAELIAETAQDDGRATDVADAQIIIDSSRHLLALISEILDFSKLEAGKMEFELSAIGAQQLVNEVVKTARPLARANNNTIVTSGDEAGWVFGDETRLRQCLLNLLSNAAKFTKDGIITLSVCREDRFYTPGCRFDVSDNGIGIEPEKIQRLFDPFTQADETITRRYGGTGLGLAITKQLIQQMGGAISVESKVGQGSTFSLWVRQPTAVAQPHSPALKESMA